MVGYLSGQPNKVVIHGIDQSGALVAVPVDVDGNFSAKITALASGVFPSDKTYTRTMAQGTAVATGTPALTYSVDLSGIDMDTATIVLVTSAGSVTVDAQVSFDGSSNKAPSTAVTLFSAVSAGTYIIGLKNILVSGSNPIYGHYMTGDIDISSAASDIDMYLMAQGK